MKLDNSNKRYPNFIAGILIISVASIFMACTFGIWDHKVISNENPLPYGIVIPAGSGNNLIENNYLVIPPGVGFLPAHEKIVKVFDTVDEGWLYFDQSGIPSSFPLTITQDILDLWSVTVYSYGGYEFVSGSVDLYQKGDYMGTITYGVDVVTQDQPFAIDLDGDGVDDAYTVDIYELDFTLASGEINLDSNYLPKLYDHGWMRVFDGPCPDDLDKEVKFKENMIWSGCHQQDQQFRVLLAYFCMLWSPELPVFIASLR